MIIDQSLVGPNVSSVLLGPQEYSYVVEPTAIHRYTNGYEARTIRLNLYVKPIEKWREYNEKGASTERMFRMMQCLDLMKTGCRGIS